MVHCHAFLFSFFKILLVFKINFHPGSKDSHYIITKIMLEWLHVVSVLFVSFILCLQCFDAVGWAAGRASGL